MKHAFLISSRLYAASAVIWWVILSHTYKRAPGEPSAPRLASQLVAILACITTAILSAIFLIAGVAL